MAEYTDEEAKWHVDAISWLKGGLIPNRETALKFAELILQATEGPERAGRQQPLTVTEQGDTWRIEGRPQPAGEEMELATGTWRMVCKKRDAQIVDIGSPATVKLSPEAERLVESIGLRHRRKP
jgi:hypothetical protein